MSKCQLESRPMTDAQKLKRLQDATRRAINLLTAVHESDEDLPVCLEVALKELNAACKEVGWATPLPAHLVDKIS